MQFERAIFAAENRRITPRKTRSSAEGAQGKRHPCRPFPLTSDKRSGTLLSNDKGREMNESREDTRAELLQGTLDMLILKTVALGPVHGWGISQRIQQISRDVLQVHQGSLYPALIRLERKGWIQATWGASENNRRAKFYEITEPGRRRLLAETASWERLSEAITRILQTA